MFISLCNKFSLISLAVLSLIWLFCIFTVKFLSFGFYTNFYNPIIPYDVKWF